jgi:predicted enzyme related to lactoylglutathione lyase
MATSFALAMVVCSDVGRSRNFYRDVVGLKVRTDAAPHWVDFDLGGGHSLGLHPVGNGLAVHASSIQLGFYVPDVDAFVYDAATLGANVLQEPYDEAMVGRMAVIADPDGYPVQIASQPAARA